LLVAGCLEGDLATWEVKRTCPYLRQLALALKRTPIKGVNRKRHQCCAHAGIVQTDAKIGDPLEKALRRFDTKAKTRWHLQPLNDVGDISYQLTCTVLTLHDAQGVHVVVVPRPVLELRIC
jgi:hypothetical protein